MVYALVVGFSAYFGAYQYDLAQNIEAASVQGLHRLDEGFFWEKRREVQGLSESYGGQ